MAAVDGPADPFLNEVGILTSDHHVQDSSRGGHNQNGRENAEERKDDQHLPSNCAPGFFYILNELHWLSEAIRWASAYALATSVRPRNGPSSPLPDTIGTIPAATATAPIQKANDRRFLMKSLRG